MHIEGVKCANCLTPDQVHTFKYEDQRDRIIAALRSELAFYKAEEARWRERETAWLTRTPSPKLELPQEVKSMCDWADGLRSSFVNTRIKAMAAFIRRIAGEEA